MEIRRRTLLAHFVNQGHQLVHAKQMADSVCQIVIVEGVDDDPYNDAHFIADTGEVIYISECECEVCNSVPF